MADNGGYDEIIGITLDGNQWAGSLGDAEKQYDAFIASLNSKEVEIAPTFEDTQIKQAIAALNQQITRLSDTFAGVFDNAAQESQAAVAEIAGTFSSIAEAASAGEKAQTIAVAEGAKQRAAIRAEEAAGAVAMAREIESAEARASITGAGGGGGGGLLSRTGVRRNMREGITSGGIGGMLSGLGGSVAMVAEYLVLWKAVQVVIDGIADVIEAPFKAVKDGVEFLGKFQESASQLSANLLDHGIFSKDPAENLKLAQTAAQGLQKTIYDISAQLGLTPDKMQAAFESFNSFGGANLTHNLNDEAQLSGYSLAALQSQNPQVLQRTVRTQMQKLVSGTLTSADKLPSAFGLSAEQLNRMAEGARTTHDLLQQIIAAAPGLAERFGTAGQRFESLVQGLKVWKDVLEGTAAAPLFDMLTSGMRKLSDYLEANKEKIESFASAMGSLIADLAKSFGELGLSMLRSLTPVLKNLTWNMTTLLDLVTKTANIMDHLHPVDAIAQGNAITGTAALIAPNADGSTVFNANKKVDADEKNLYDVLFNGKTDPAMAALEKQITDALGKYQPKGINTPGATTSEQVSKLREAYTAEIKDITTAGAEFRKQLDADVKAGIATLENATKERATSYDSQAKEVEAAGQRYVNAIRGVHGKGASSAQTKARDTVAANDRKAIDDEINGKRADLQKLTTLNEQIAEAKAKSDESLNRAALEHSTSVISEQQQRGVLSPEQAATVKYQNASLDIAVQLDALQAQLKAITGNDAASVKRRANINNQIAGVQQRGQFETADFNEQSARFSEQERQRSEQNQVNRDKERTQELEQRQQLELASHVAQSPADIHQDAANVLQSRLQENAAAARLLTDKLDSLIAEIIDRNPQDAANAIKNNPKVNALQLKLASLAVDRQVVQQQEIREQDAAKLGNQAAAAFFGGQSGQQHWDNLTDASHSLSSAANNISQGVGNVISGYQQGGIGGAVGAGLQTVGQFIPGPAGAVISAVGSLTSMFSGLFNAAAQNIGREVAKAVDKVMEKYSTGQIPLVQAIQQVQQQINTLITSESGRKGGQQVIDNELPQLQQTLDSLKYQQQQEKWNFQDLTIEGSSTNSVTQQWLTDWININKQVEEYQKAVGSAGDAQIAQYLNEQMAQQQVNLENQYNQGQTTAINDALQLNQLLQQRNNYEDQYRKQQFDILSADSLQRRGNPAIQAAQKLSLAKSQYDQETQQLNFQISMTQQKVDLETQIFHLASDTATLQSEALTAQNYQLQQQMSQYEAIAQLLAETAGATYANGSWNIPSGITTGDGGPFGIPGTSNVSNADNSIGVVNNNVVVQVPAGMSASDLADKIASSIEYKARIGANS